jgi:UDP-glucose 4-epimerase
MRTFVTGGAGYIGSVCAEELLAAGHEVVVYDSLVHGHRAAVPRGARFVQGDLADRATLGRTLAEARPEVILHFAAHALVGESMANPGKYFRNNVGAGLNLLEAAVAAGVSKIVFSSTCATYGVPERTPITEELPPRPINPYGESKLMFERMLEWFERVHGLGYVAFRYFNAAGATAERGEHHSPETHLVPNVLRVALGQAAHCEIYGADYPTPDGTCIRDYIHVADLARAHVLALAPGARGIYNLGTGDGCSVRQVLAACEAASGRTIPAVLRPRRPGDPARLVASADRARRELGWVPRWTRLEDIVASAWAWHRAHPHGYAD